MVIMDKIEKAMLKMLESQENFTPIQSFKIRDRVKFDQRGKKFEEITLKKGDIIKFNQFSYIKKTTGLFGEAKRLYILGGTLNDKYPITFEKYNLKKFIGRFKKL